MTDEGHEISKRKVATTVSNALQLTLWPH